MANAKRVTFKEKHHPACLSRVLRRALATTSQMLFRLTYTLLLICLLLNCSILLLLIFAFTDNASAGSARIIIFSLYFACFIAIAFANNSRNSRIIGNYTLPTCSNAFLRSYFVQSNFRSRAELVA